MFRGDMIRELWIDSLRATIAQRKARYAQLDGEMKYMDAGTDEDLLIQATMTLGEVDEHVAVVKAKKDAAIKTFDTLYFILARGDNSATN